MNMFTKKNSNKEAKCLWKTIGQKFYFQQSLIKIINILTIGIGITYTYLSDGSEKFTASHITNFNEVTYLISLLYGKLTGKRIVDKNSFRKIKQVPTPLLLFNT